MPAQHTTKSDPLRSQIQAAITRMECVLPEQAALKDFVHHNTLHGFQHLPFAEALATAHKITGIYGYHSQEIFRRFYQQGRITKEDLRQVLLQDPKLNASEKICHNKEIKELDHLDLLIIALLHPLEALTTGELTWQIDECNVLHAFAQDVEKIDRNRLLAAAKRHGECTESDAIKSLWTACLNVLGLNHYILHPEELLDITPEQGEQMLSQVVHKKEHHSPGALLMDQLIEHKAGELMTEVFASLGHQLTLAGLLQKLTGADLMKDMRPQLVRHIGSFLDQGQASWHSPDRKQGFYTAWRAGAAQDLAWVFEDLPDWTDAIAALPEDPMDVTLMELRWLGLAEEKWSAYLQRLALELPGWAGMFLWRHQRPNYHGLTGVKVEMLDFLAVRLVLERLFAQRLCRQLWRIEASFDVIRWYFGHHSSEFLVRYLVHKVHLPEYLVTLAQPLLNGSSLQEADETQWRHLAHMIWTWRQSPATDLPKNYSVHHHAWPLFLLAQHLGLCGAEIRTLDHTNLQQIFACISSLDAERAGYIWLQAYERKYRDQLLNALQNNIGRGRWKKRTCRPVGQMIFCMDDREEGLRRHLEKRNAAIETFGAAGFFGIPIHWQGLDDHSSTPLCPIVVTPAHLVKEQPQQDHKREALKYAKRRSLRIWWKDLLWQETRRTLLFSTLLILAAAPVALWVLIAKLLAPRTLGSLADRIRQRFEQAVPTQVSINAVSNTLATPENPRQGLTDTEQADRVQGFLRTIGLQQSFAPLVVLLGHGSNSQNNPHIAAYDCGACSGRHGGPNARVFAAMANRPAVRTLLQSRGCVIPEDTWFLGVEHNTCNEAFSWYDMDAMPVAARKAFAPLRSDLEFAACGSAHERARRLASAPTHLNPKQALHHMQARALDFSQVRPELGHATNAAAIIGRRSLSQGLFLDRRVFLISYDPTQDPTGEVVEAILLAAGPVGASINLEYYFSTVNNDQYGCGSKVTHNVTGLFGVMEGTSSDLRTGLPRQMIEIHEAMRLQVVVEASIEVITRIYQRQPSLQELIGNGWLLLNVMNPESGELSLFTPDRGFEPWRGKTSTLPTVLNSAAWYAGHNEALSPVLLATEQEHG